AEVLSATPRAARRDAARTVVRRRYRGARGPRARARLRRRRRTAFRIFIASRLFSDPHRLNRMMHERRVSAGLLASCAMHAAMIAVTMLSMRAALRSGAHVPAITDERQVSLIWSGGGGGGGDNTTLPPRRAERRGTDTRTLPVGPMPAIDPSR